MAPLTAALDAIRAIADAARRTPAERALARVARLRGRLLVAQRRKASARRLVDHLRADARHREIEAALRDAERHLDALLAAPETP